MWFIPQCGGLWFTPQCDEQCGSYHSVVDYVVGLPQCDGLGVFYHSVAYYVVDCVFPYQCGRLCVFYYGLVDTNVFESVVTMCLNFSTA